MNVLKLRIASIKIALAVIILAPFQAKAYLHIADAPATSSGKVAASCLPPSAATDLDINNVQALIQTGGDMWWDLQGVAKYEVPKVENGNGPTAIFAGSLWLGGVDVSNQLKVAAQRFRQVGNDFWTGPLRNDNAETTAEVCQLYDRHFKTTKIEVETFVAWNNAKTFDAENPGENTAEESFPNYSVPLTIQEWPGNYTGPDADFYDFNLAPFEDIDGDGVYNWQAGDYPKYNLSGDGDCSTEQLNEIYGDQNLWWVFNDNGNIHTESGSSQAIGMEIKAQAFAFATNDEVNNMTFYNYNLINRSTFTLAETYFGFWVDPDLGGAQDDFVGCDVSRGLGFCYNGDAYDESANGALGYLDKPAAIGVDFFQGPFQDFDGEDNDWYTKENPIPDGAVEGNGVGYADGIPDNERFGMRRFLYHNNDNSPTGDPSTATDYYNFLRGFWSDATQMVYGGTGYVNGCSAPFSCNPATFMFPGDSDTENWGTGQEEIPWSEETSGNTPQDRRFLQSAGPFTLAPGAQNYITVGVVFAQATTGGPLASVQLLKEADNKTQAAFDNCFKILEGPYAPEMTFQELDQELIVYLDNPITSNNYKEGYAQLDPTLPAPEEVLVGTQQVVVPDTTAVSFETIVDMDTLYATDSTIVMDSIFVYVDTAATPDDSVYYVYSYTEYNTPEENGVFVLIDTFLIDPSTGDQIDVPLTAYVQTLNPVITTETFQIPVYTIEQNIETSFTFQSLTEQEKIDYSTYYFQGYKVYQVKNKSISSADLDDVDKARLAFQCDIKDGVSSIINYEFDESTQQTVPRLKVEGQDDGISHSFKLESDLFATGDNKLVNHKEYYFMAVAYAYNYSQYNEFDPNNTLAGGQKLPYLESGKGATGTSVQVFTAIPHKTSVENDGTILNSGYGDEVELTRYEGKGNGGRFLKLTQGSVDEIMSGSPWGAATVTYQEGFAPISVKVIDPLNVPSGDFTFRMTEDDTIRDPLLKNANWQLDFVGQVGGRDTSLSWTSDNTIEVGNEQLLLDVGLSIYIEQVPFIETGEASESAIAYLNGVVGAEIEFSDPSDRWLDAIPDNDANNNTNWIRSGKTDVDGDDLLSDYYTVSGGENKWVDPLSIYENILGGTFAPYKLTAAEANGPMATRPNSFDYVANSHMINNRLRFLNDVDIIFTSDKSKWTRCVVLETQRDATVSINAGLKGFPRRSLSVDKNGNAMDTTGIGGNLDALPASDDPNAPNFVSAYGMSWFPGYAIDVQTGERLNMSFGEDSWLKSQNGSDMIWNPTSDIFEGPFDDVRLAGKHFIYVYRNNVVEDDFPLREDLGLFAYSRYAMLENLQAPAYDEGRFNITKLKEANGSYTSREFISVHQAISWAGFPRLADGFELNSVSEGIVPSPLTIRLRVMKPYETYVFNNNNNNTFDVGESLPNSADYYVQRGPIEYNGKTYQHGDNFYADAGTSFGIPAVSGAANQVDSFNNVILTQNAGLPFYTFNTNKYAATQFDNSTAVEALDLITAVPNPYYAYSSYETDRLDNRIKIINLPEECTVSIYTSSGILVRQLTKDDPSVTSLQWDLKNTANITVSSGIYIIHVDAPGVGEKIVKWFGMMRPIDLDSF